jgi:hypothetical protein
MFDQWLSLMEQSGMSAVDSFDKALAVPGLQLTSKNIDAAYEQWLNDRQPPLADMDGEWLVSSMTAKCDSPMHHLVFAAAINPVSLLEASVDAPDAVAGLYLMASPPERLFYFALARRNQEVAVAQQDGKGVWKPIDGCELPADQQGKPIKMTWQIRDHVIHLLVNGNDLWQTDLTDPNARVGLTAQDGAATFTEITIKKN